MIRQITSKDVLYEDNHLIVINKMPSDIVQGDQTGDVPLSEPVKSYIKKKYKKPGDVFLGVTHRLDRPVSGAVIFARTSKGLARVNEMFREKSVKKTYWAIVKKKPIGESGKLVHYLKKDHKKNKSTVYDKEVKGAQRAELDYKLLAMSDNFYLLEINLHTGRHHQIRAQLSRTGCPIRGDLKYGYDRSNRDGSIHLHARKLEFEHPVKKEPVSIIAPVPDESLWRYFEDIVS